MILAQATEAVKTISAYDDSKIVVGIIICFALMVGFVWVYDKYLKTKVDFSKIPPPQINISKLDALEITTTMIEKILKIPIEGSTIEKRAKTLQHDTAQALANVTDMSTLATEILNELKTSNTNMVDFYEAQNQETKRLNNTIIGLLTKGRK